MKHRDLVSIVIPVYNVEKYVDECISSVVAQTYKDLEIILIDDGSTDGSGIKCDMWASKDNRITVLHKDNGGLSSARNVGIKAASGKYIGFVDSDDWIEENMYEELIKLIKKSNYSISVCGIIRTDNIFLQDETEKISEYTPKEYIKKILKVGTQDSNHYACNKLYEKKLLSDAQYPEGLTDEDVEGTLKAVLNSTAIIETSKRYYHYRIDNDNSITAPLFNRKRLDFLTICDDIVNLVQDEDSDICTWAEAFRKRANFGVLSRMAVMPIADDMKNDYESTREVLVTKLKKDSKDLLRMEIPISRKVLVILYCVNYDLTAKVLSKMHIRVK